MSLIKHTVVTLKFYRSIYYVNSIQTTYIYDGGENTTMTSEGKQLLNFDYSYNQNGNRLSKIGLNQEVHNAYVSVNCLFKATYNEREVVFAYNAVVMGVVK